MNGTERSAFFQQVTVNEEAVSNDWNFNAYALIPVGDTEQKLNWYCQGGASITAQHKDVQQNPVINALTSTPSNRDVRVNDYFVNQGSGLDNLVVNNCR